jgi:hypothetical protein
MLIKTNFTDNQVERYFGLRASHRNGAMAIMPRPLYIYINKGSLQPAMIFVELKRIINFLSRRPRKSCKERRAKGEASPLESSRLSFRWEANYFALLVSSPRRYGQ